MAGNDGRCIQVLGAEAQHQRVAAEAVPDSVVRKVRVPVFGPVRHRRCVLLDPVAHFEAAVLLGRTRAPGTAVVIGNGHQPVGRRMLREGAVETLRGGGGRVHNQHRLGSNRGGINRGLDSVLGGDQDAHHFGAGVLGLHAATLATSYRPVNS